MSTTTFYDNRHLLALSIVLLLVAGISALLSLPRLEDPRITLRNPLVLTFFPGASAERVEALVSKPLEETLREMHEIKHIESISRAGASAINIELQDWVDADTNQAIFSQIRDRVGATAERFPAQVNTPIFDDERGATAFTLLLALSPKSADSNRLKVVTRLAEALGDRLRNIAGTDIVRIYGAPDEEIQVRVDAGELAALDLSTAHIAELIAQADSKTAAGALRTTDRDVFMEVRGELDSLARIARIPVGATQDDSLLFLGDIAEIRKTQISPPLDIARANGAQSIFLAVRMTDAVRVDQWTQQADKVLADFKAELGGSLNIDTVFAQNHYTEQRLAQLAGNLVAGVCVVMLVVLLFMGWKSSLIVGMALPLSLAGALFALGVLDQQLHQMTIFGMIIAIGLLIDNAIVMTDEVRKNIHERGLARRDALLKAVRHLRVPLIASTVTTILGFMPVFLLQGNIGDFVGPIAIAVVLALAFSLLISLTVIASLAAIFSQPNQTARIAWWNNGMSSHRLAALYRRGLNAALRWPLPGIGLALILPVAGFVLAGSLSKQFFPSADRDHFQIEVWMTEGSAVQSTAAQVERIDAWLRRQDGVARTLWLSGSSIPSVYYNQIMDKDRLAAYAQGVVFADSVERAAHLVDYLQAELDERFPASQIVVRAFGQGPPIAAPVSFRLSGGSSDTLRRLGEEVRRVMAAHPQVTHTQASVSGGKPKFWLQLDEDKVRLAGLTLTEVAQHFQAQLEGITGGTLLEDVESLPVRVRLESEHQSDLARIQSLQIISPATHEWIPLGALGDITLQPSVTAITRRNGARVNNVYAYLEPGAPAIDVSNAILEALDDSGFELPPGYRLSVGGDADEQNNALGQLAAYLPVLVALMLTTLILSFRSVALAAVIGIVTVLSAGLGLFSLWLSGFPIGFNPLLGLAGLIGVAINGSIVVLAAIRANPQAAVGDKQAIVDETIGCARHILSTTLTTMAGFSPLLLGGGSFWPPLAVVIAGGVGFSVVLSLLFTPVVYGVLYRCKVGLSAQAATNTPMLPSGSCELPGG